ncbi:uncharacterized protein LOC144878831 [Branchiostoma floridae x Branchiostoma japonicum]
MASVRHVRCIKDKFRAELGRFVPSLVTTLYDFENSELRQSTFNDTGKVITDPIGFLRENGADFSVYCVDFDRRVLGLVKVRDLANSSDELKKAPFFFKAQRENTEKLLTIPFDLLPSIATSLEEAISTVRNVFLFDTGRCGSTLLCKAMDSTAGVQAVSEPDVYTSVFVFLQHHNFDLTHAAEEEAIMVLRCSTILLNFYFLKNDPSRQVICYKPRSCALFIADLLQRAVPSAKTIFLYRNLPGFFDSWASVMFSGSYWRYYISTALKIDAFYHIPNYIQMEPSLKFFTDNHRLVKYPAARGIPFFLVSSWLLRMQKAYDLINDDQSSFFHAIVTYKELVTHKERAVLKVLKEIGVDVPPEEIVKIKQVFGKDSQEGAGIQSVRRKGDISKNTWIGNWERKLFSSVIECFSGDLYGPEFVLQNTTVEV